MARQDLVLDPAAVLGWWWYALVQQGIDSPAGLTISCLEGPTQVLEGFSGLAHFWPEVTPDHRQEIEGMVQRNWGAAELAHHWSESYPRCTALSFIALKELYLADFDVLAL